MPWLAGTALLHSARGDGKGRCAESLDHLLAINRVSRLSLIGTFLVRSGVLTSVHAFATDPTRGIFILVISHRLYRRCVGAVRLACRVCSNRAALSRRSRARAR